MMSFKGRQSGGGAGKAMGGREHGNVVATVTKAPGSQNFSFVPGLDRMLLCALSTPLLLFSIICF